MKRKNTTKIIISVAISLIVIVIVGLLYYFNTKNTAYTGQCSLPDCPAGYSLKSGSEYCNGKTCYAECQKALPPKCGTFISKSKSEAISLYKASVSSVTVNAPSESSSKCYSYQPEGYFGIDSRNSCGAIYTNSNSHKITLKASWTTLPDPTNKCSTASTYKFSYPQWTNSIFGVSGSVKSVTATINAYSSNLCSGSVNCGSNGVLMATINWQEAPVITEYQKQQISCSFDCETDTDCGQKQQISEQYCSGQDILQDFMMPTCSNNACSQETTTEKIKTCSSNEYCSVGQCIATPSDEILIYVYRFENDECNYIQIAESEILENDYSTLSECQSNINGELPVTYYRYFNNKCTAISLLMSQKTQNDYSTIEECQTKIIDVPTGSIIIYRSSENCNQKVILLEEKLSTDYSSLQECENAKTSSFSFSPIILLIIGGIVIFILLLILIIRR